MDISTINKISGLVRAEIELNKRLRLFINGIY
jgi:hypothetical protein